MSFASENFRFEMISSFSSSGISIGLNKTDYTTRWDSEKSLDGGRGRLPFLFNCIFDSHRIEKKKMKKCVGQLTNYANMCVFPIQRYEQ